MRKAATQYGSAEAGGFPAAVPLTLCDALEFYRVAIEDAGEQSVNFLPEIAGAVMEKMSKNGLKYTARQLMDVIDTCNPQTKADEFTIDAFRQAADKYVSVEGELWNDNPKFRGSR
jgi:hypothetical protein